MTQIDTMFQDNHRKILELKQDKQWAAFTWHDECWTQGLRMKIYDGHRPQETQMLYFAKGRDEEEFARLLKYGLISRPQHDALVALVRKNVDFPDMDRVTWTLDSYHTRRLALDVRPINCSFADLRAVAGNYGITCPVPGDEWHFQFDKARSKPLSLMPVVRSLQARVDALKRAIARTNGERRFSLQRLLARLLKRDG